MQAKGTFGSTPTWRGWWWLRRCSIGPARESSSLQRDGELVTIDPPTQQCVCSTSRCGVAYSVLVSRFPCWSHYFIYLIAPIAVCDSITRTTAV